MLLLNYAHSMQNSMGDIWISASHIQGPINQCYQQMNYVGKLHSMKSGNEDRLSWRRQLWQAVIVNIALLVQGEQGRKKQKKEKLTAMGSCTGQMPNFALPPAAIWPLRQFCLPRFLVLPCFVFLLVYFVLFLASFVVVVACLFVFGNHCLCNVKRTPLKYFQTETFRLSNWGPKSYLGGNNFREKGPAFPIRLLNCEHLQCTMALER